MSSDPFPPPPAPGDSLPPVEPPSAAFLVQLFLIPGLIVGIIVLVWSAFHWLAGADTMDPQHYVQKLRTDSPDLWQTAEHLAEMLRNDRSGALRGDGKLAAELADILQQRINRLQQQIANGQPDSESINVCVYLSKALGLFNTTTGVPVLIATATTSRDPTELPVRRAALDSLALLVENVKPTDAAFADPKFVDAIQKLSRDTEPVIRLRAAYILGLTGGEKSLDRLAEMLDDPYPDVAYNAATGLARHGDARALDQLRRMLNPDQSAAVSTEEKDQQDDKRWLIVLNGLRAVEKLAAANPKADLSPFASAIKTLQAANPPAAVRDEALRVGELLDKHGSAAK